VSKNIPEGNSLLTYFVSAVAWLAFLLVLFVLFMGDDILQEIATIYPDWSFPAFFIPWFLLVISSVQKLRDNNPHLRLQIWILKTTVPIFIFVMPFFAKALSFSVSSDSAQVAFAPYCLYFAIMVLFLAHFLPRFNAKQSSL